MSSFASAIDGFLGISVIGWALVGAIYAPATIVLVVLARDRWLKRPMRTVAAASAIYLPLLAGVAEAVYVDEHFKSLCATAGVKVKRAAVVEGFYSEPRGWSWEDSLRAGQGGYRYNEWVDRAGKTWRSELIEPGVVRRVAIDGPSANYAWQFPLYPTSYGHLIDRRESSVIDRRSGEVIATHVIVHRHPPAIDRLWRQYMGGGTAMCGESGDLLSNALPGIDRKEK